MKHWYEVFDDAGAVLARCRSVGECLSCERALAARGIHANHRNVFSDGRRFAEDVK